MHELQIFCWANPHLSDPSVETYDAKACPDPIGHDCPNDGLSPKGAPGHDVLVPQSRGLDGSDAQGPFWVGHHDSDQYTASGNERQMI